MVLCKSIKVCFRVLIFVLNTANGNRGSLHEDFYLWKTQRNNMLMLFLAIYKNIKQYLLNYSKMGLYKYISFRSCLIVTLVVVWLMGINIDIVIYIYIKIVLYQYWKAFNGSWISAII
jgi:hypothetical protein